MEKVKKFLSSQKGMRLVNVLFILATLSRNNILIILACLFWIIYLRYCIINTASKATKMVYRGFSVFACALILLNLWALLNLGTLFI